MGRKGSLILIIVLVGGLGILAWFIQNGSKIIVTDPYSLVPADACIMAESVDLPGMLGSITEGNSIFRELASVKELDAFTRKIVFLRDFINRKDLVSFFERNRSVISFHSNGRGDLVPFLSMNVPPRTRYRNILDALKTTGSRVSEERLGKSRVIIMPYSFSGEQDTVYFSFTSGLLVGTPSLQMMKKVISGSNSDIRNAAGFSRIMSAAGKGEDKIFIIFRNLAEMVKSLGGDKNAFLANDLYKLAGSAEGDVYINSNGIILSGYTETSDSSEYLFKYKSGPSGKLNSSDVLPSEVILFKTILLPGKIGIQSVSMQQGDSSLGIATALVPFLGDEITSALLKGDADEIVGEPIMIYELRDRTMAESIISSKILLSSGEGNDENKGSILYFQPDDQTKLPVYCTPYRNLSDYFVPRFSSSVNDTLIAFYDNYMITGCSFSAVSRVLYANILKKTLSNDLTFRDFETTLPSRAGYYFYCVPSALPGYLSGRLSDSLTNALRRNLPVLNKIQALGYQLAPSNGMIYNTLSVRFGDTKIETGAEWETLLDTAACIKPFFFTNHSTGAKEIFIQDYRNNCYLVNGAGRVLWKVSLNERINGEVFMIDYYGNGKYQLLFAGKNWLHLLDRNGNYVERFPVRLRSPASGPPALFDYDGTKEYRIIIPGDDRFIYAYDKSGNVVKGWKPFKTNGPVKTALKFFRISGKDFLVAADNVTLYFLDRTGNIRLNLRDQVTKAKGSEIRLFTGQQPSLVLSSPDGTIELVGFDGKVTKTTFRQFTSDHTFDFFDVDGDGFGEYVFIDKGRLYLYDNDRSEIFSRDFGSEFIEGPINFVFSSSDRKIGLFDNKKKQIYLIDQKGNTMKGFPLRGASAFSIGKLSDTKGYNLVVGGDDNFLYNYKLESGN